MKLETCAHQAKIFVVIESKQVKMASDESSVQILALVIELMEY